MYLYNEDNRKACWLDVSGEPAHTPLISRSSQQPPQWNGEGWPPVGQKCLNREGREGVIVAHVTDSNGDIEAIMQCSDDWHICGEGDAKPINPIKSERDRQIEAIESIVSSVAAGSDVEPIAEALYTAGCRIGGWE
jgi:hypothetical protein